MGENAARRVWFGIAPDGSEHEIVLCVGVPELQPAGEWRAVVSLGALETRTYRIIGIDAWQAVELGMLFAARLVQGRADNGWRFFWEPGGSSPASASELAHGL